MTVLDARTGIDRLGPTPLSLLRDAIDRAEGDLGELPWDIYASADAEAFKGLDIDSLPLALKGQSRREFIEHLGDTRGEIEREVDAAGDRLREKVLAILHDIADEMESELVRLAL